MSFYYIENLKNNLIEIFIRKIRISSVQNRKKKYYETFENFHGNMQKF